MDVDAFALLSRDSRPSSMNAPPPPTVSHRVSVLRLLATLLRGKDVACAACALYSAMARPHATRIRGYDSIVSLCLLRSCHVFSLSCGLPSCTYISPLGFLPITEVDGTNSIYSSVIFCISYCPCLRASQASPGLKPVSYIAPEPIGHAFSTSPPSPPIRLFE